MPNSRWGTEALWQQLEPLLPGLSIEVVARTGSTNTELLERARLHGHRAGDSGTRHGRRAGDTQPCLLVAEHQTSGRGRLGRAWKSAPDVSLTFSLSLPLAASDWSGLSLAVGVALAEALEPAPAGAPQLLLKWPNDLLLVDAAGAAPRKLGGVLVESIAVGVRRLAVIGIGLNIAPYDVGDLPGGYACVSELHPGASAAQVLARVSEPLARALIEFDANQRGGPAFAPFVPRYAARDWLRGQRVQATPGGPAGVADGVAPDGALRLVGDDGALTLISSGEVSIRPAPRGAG